MASRRSSQLSYSRASAEFSQSSWLARGWHGRFQGLCERRSADVHDRCGIQDLDLRAAGAKAVGIEDRRHLASKR